MGVLESISAAIIEGRKDAIVALTQEALGEGISPKDILNRGLVGGMDVVGARFRKGDMFVPEVLLSARTMQASLSLIKPKLAEAGVESTGTVVLGTVFGDLHDIGKNIVGIMLEGAGFSVVDLGNNVPVEKFVEAVRQHRPDVLGLSALLTTTMRQMGRVVNALKDAGLRDGLRIMVGGAPVTAEFAREVGADAYGSNGVAAAQLARGFMAEKARV